MLNVLNRAKRYRELAEGCRNMAASGQIEIRNHYLRMAEYYSRLAEAEERRPMRRA
jgi:hypothetical protein